MSRHTPGPWVQKLPAVSGNICIYAGGKREGYGIGEAWNINDNAENFANARLIAAAPELLDALKHAALLGHGKCTIGKPLAGMVIAAIAKAEGLS